jgi:predicted PurR-regulated permease PerM
MKSRQFWTGTLSGFLATDNVTATYGDRMDRKQATTTIFLVILAAIALYFCYLIAKPFLSPIFLAIKRADLVGLGIRGRWAVDSLVRPYVISGRVKVNTLLVFFALLGGVKAFGVMGLFIGPVVLSITIVVLKMLQETNLDYPAA